MSGVIKLYVKHDGVDHGTLTKKLALIETQEFLHLNNEKIENQFSKRVF